MTRYKLRLHCAFHILCFHSPTPNPDPKTNCLYLSCQGTYSMLRFECVTSSCASPRDCWCCDHPASPRNQLDSLQRPRQGSHTCASLQVHTLNAPRTCLIYVRAYHIICWHIICLPLRCMRTPGPGKSSIKRSFCLLVVAFLIGLTTVAPSPNQVTSGLFAMFMPSGLE